MPFQSVEGFCFAITVAAPCLYEGNGVSWCIECSKGLALAPCGHTGVWVIPLSTSGCFCCTDLANVAVRTLYEWTTTTVVTIVEVTQATCWACDRVGRTSGDLVVLQVWHQLMLVRNDTSATTVDANTIVNERGWHDFVKVLSVHHHAEAELLQVGQTRCLAGLFTCLCENWEQNRCQDSNNCNYDEEFDERKRSLCTLHGLPLLRVLMPPCVGCAPHSYKYEHWEYNRRFVQIATVNKEYIQPVGYIGDLCKSVALSRVSIATRTFLDRGTWIK